MFKEPTKVFPCDCGGEGITVTKDYYEDDVSEGEVAVSKDAALDGCEESPFIRLSFWEFGHHRHGRWSVWQRIKMAYQIIFKKKGCWEDMVMMKASHARNFANHILYIITKGEREKKLGEPIVKDPTVVGLKPVRLTAEQVKEVQKRLTEPVVDIPLMNYGDAIKNVCRNCNSPRENKVSEELDKATDLVGDALIAELGHGGKILAEDWDELPQPSEPIHPYFCVQHGGSVACEEANKKNGFICPKCDPDITFEEIKEEKDV